MAEKRKEPEGAHESHDAAKASKASAACAATSTSVVIATRAINYDELGTAKVLLEALVKGAEELRHERVLAGTEGKAGKGNGQFKHPRQLAIDSEDNVVVADCDNNQIQIISSEGALLRKIGSRGQGDGQLDVPTGVGLDRHRNIFVCDSWNDRVSVFTWEGEFIRHIGAGLLRYPYHIAVSQDNGRIYVINSEQVNVFTSEGEHVLAFGADRFVHGDGIALDESDNAYATDYIEGDKPMHRVVVFSKDGTFIREIGSYGYDPGQFNGPAAVCIDHHRGHVIVGDRNGMQVFNKQDGSFVCRLDDNQLLTEGLCVDSQGRIVASSFRGHTIERWA